MSLPMSKDEKMIHAYLSELGLRYELAGYTYLVEIIEYILTTPTVKTKKAMDHVGEKYGVTLKNIQNSIRYCLKKADKPTTKTDPRQVIFECVMHIRGGEVTL